MRRNRICQIVAASLAAGLLFTGCGVSANATLATLDGQEIKAGAANFLAQSRAAVLDSSMIQYYGEEMWSQDGSEEGVSMQDEYKEYLLDEIKELYLMDAHTTDYGVELTEDDENSIRSTTTSFIDANSSKALRYLGATDDTVYEYLRLLKVRSLMKTAIEADVDTEVPAEEANQSRFSYILIPSDYEPTSEDETSEDADTEDTAESEEESDAADDNTDYAAEAAEFLAVLSSGMSLEEIAEQYEDFSVQTGYYGQTDLTEEDNTTSFDLSVLETAGALSEGQTAELPVHTDAGYYILRLDALYDEEATASKRESIIEDRKEELYDAVLQGYIDAADWQLNESTWAKVNFDHLYTVVTAQQ